jgi:hypothetical protein
VADAKGCTLGFITTVGAVASAIGIFVFVTGYDTFQEAIGRSSTDIKYEDYTKTIKRSALSDYKRYVSEANTDAPISPPRLAGQRLVE